MSHTFVLLVEPGQVFNLCLKGCLKCASTCWSSVAVALWIVLFWGANFRHHCFLESGVVCILHSVAILKPAWFEVGVGLQWSSLPICLLMHTVLGSVGINAL